MHTQLGELGTTVVAFCCGGPLLALLGAWFMDDPPDGCVAFGAFETYIPLLAEYGLQNIRARLARVSALGRVGIYE